MVSAETVISLFYKTAFKFTLGPSFRSNPVYYLRPYHPELLLGSRGHFPNSGGREEAKHTLTSRAKTWILKTQRLSLSIFAILPPVAVQALLSTRNLCLGNLRTAKIS